MVINNYILFFLIIVFFLIVFFGNSYSQNIITLLLNFIIGVVLLTLLLLYNNIEFLGIIFAIIYIGAIIVLFLFTVFIFNLNQNILFFTSKNIINRISTIKKLYSDHAFLFLTVFLFGVG